VKKSISTLFYKPVQTKSLYLASGIGRWVDFFPSLRNVVSHVSVALAVTHRNRPASVGHKYRAGRPPPSALQSALEPSVAGILLGLVTAAKLMSEATALTTSRLAPEATHTERRVSRRGKLYRTTRPLFHPSKSRTDPWSLEPLNPTRYGAYARP